MTALPAYTVLANAVLAKFTDYCQMVKLRLTLMVVFSAGIGFLIAGAGTIGWFELMIVSFSGFLITGSANGINQIIEKNLDALMTRTSNRPVAQGRIGVREAGILTFLMGLGGAILLGHYINGFSAVIGIGSLLVYAFVYTPLKRMTRWSVVAGAIAGAAPPLIGYTAVTGRFDEFAILIFLIQFIWQFPHFWAIAWVLDDDYKKAGFFLLPSKAGRDRRTTAITVATTFTLIPLSAYLIYAGYVGTVTGGLIVLLGMQFLYSAVRLHTTSDMNEAKRLMFGSFYYLPLVQILLVIGSYFT